MSPASWLTLHLVATAVLTGVGWVVQAVVYPAFRRVGPVEWADYHAGHVRAIGRVVALPWALQGVSTVPLVLAPPPGLGPVVVVLAGLAVAPVVITVAVAVPAHRNLAGPGTDRSAGLAVLLPANLARTLAWTASTALAGASTAVLAG